MARTDPTPVFTKVGGNRAWPRIGRAYDVARARATQALAHDLSIKGHRHTGPAETPCPNCPNQKKRKR